MRLITGIEITGIHQLLLTFSSNRSGIRGVSDSWDSGVGLTELYFEIKREKNKKVTKSNLRKTKMIYNRV